MKKENLKKEMYLKDKSSGTYFKVKTIGTNIVCDVFGEAHFLNNIEDLNKKETNDAKSFVSSIQARIEWMRTTGVKAGDFVVARTERADGTEGYIIAGVIENPYRVLNGKVVTDFILSMGPTGLKVEEGISVPLIEIRINDNIDLLMRFVEKIPEQFKVLKHIGELFDEYDKNKWRMDLLKAKQGDILAVEFTTTTSIGILKKYVKLCSEDGCYLQMWYFMDGGTIKPDYDVIVGDYIKVRPATEEEKKHYANKLMGFSKVFPLDKVGRGEFKEEYLPKTDITPTEINKDSWDEKEILKTPSEDQTQLADRPETEYKNDKLDDKLRWDLLPMSEIEDLVKLYHRGAKKYKPDSWKQLNDGFNRYRAALLRHMMAYLNGERYDKETGSNHLTAVAWNAIAMLWFDKHGKGLIPLDKPEDADRKDDDNQESYGSFSGGTFVLNDELNDKFIQKLKEILPIAKKTRVCDFKALYADVFDDDFIKEHDFVVIDFTDKNIPPATHIKLKWVTINNGLFPSAEFNNSYNERVAAFIKKNEDGDYIVTCLTQGGRKKA